MQVERSKAAQEEPGTWHVFPSGFCMLATEAVKLIDQAVTMFGQGKTKWGRRAHPVWGDLDFGINDFADAMRYAAQASYPQDAFDDVHDWAAKTIRSRHERRNRDFPNASPEYKAAAEAAQKKDPPPPGTPLFVNPQTGEIKW